MKKIIYISLFYLSTFLGFSQVPAAGFITTSNECENSPIQFSDQSSNNPTSWTWTFTAGSPSTSTSQNPSITYTAAGTYVIALVATNTVGASSVYTTNIVVHSTPTVAVTSQTACNGSPATLTASGASTYVWMPGGSTGSTRNTTASSLTVYTVTGTSAFGCQGVDNATLTVLPKPTVSVNSGSICEGSPLALIPSGAVSYSWSTGSTSQTIAVSPSVDASYNVTGTGANGCKNSAVSQVTVFPLPIVSLTSGTVCPGQSVVLYATGANSYTWSVFSETDDASVSPTVTTTYTCEGSYLNGCTSSATTTVYVTAPPDFSLTTATVCPGITATLIATPITSDISSFFWSNGTNATSAAVSQTTTTIYNCTANTNNGCSATKTTTLYIYPSPVLGSTTGTVCTGKTFTINASGAVSYTWSTGSNSAFIAVTPTITTSYGFTGESVNGCINNAITTVSVISLPNITIAPKAICLGKSTVLNAQGGNSYIWSTSATTQTISITPTANTTYTCVGMAVTGCSNIAVTTVTVYPTPTVTLSTATICSGQTATLTAGSANTYTWSNGNHSSSIYVVPSATTNYTCVGLSINNCDFTSTTVVNVISITTPSITQAGNVLTSSSSTGNQWYLNGAIIPGATAQTYMFTQNGNYAVAVTGSNGCQSSFANISIFDTGLADFDLREALTIFPNPTNGNVNITFKYLINESFSIRVYSSNGQVVKEEMVNTTNTLVNMETMPVGIYTIEVILKQHKAYIKVVKI